MSTLSTPAGRTWACNLPYVPVQAAPSGFVTGNCLQGTHLRREAYSGTYNGTHWDGGYIFGNYAGCSWIQHEYTSLAGDLTQTLCSGYMTIPNADYQRYNNNATGAGGDCSWKPGSDGVYRCTDGTSTTIIEPCTAWGNFRPWAVGQAQTDPIRIYPAGKVVKWRYMTKFDAPNGLPMVMVRDPSYSAGQGNWFFINASCLNAYPGATTNVG